MSVFIFYIYEVLGSAFGKRIPPEEKRYAPDRREGYEHINHSAEDRACSAEQPCHKVKAEYPHETPVKTAYDKKRKCDFIKHFLPILSDFCAVNRQTPHCLRCAEKKKIKEDTPGEYVSGTLKMRLRVPEGVPPRILSAVIFDLFKARRITQQQAGSFPFQRFPYRYRTA